MFIGKRGCRYGGKNVFLQNQSGNRTEGFGMGGGGEEGSTKVFINGVYFSSRSLYECVWD